MSTSPILTAKVSLKLLIDKKTNKVVFAEASKDFVDFLFSIPSFPLGTVVKQASKDQNLQGSLGTLYQGIQLLSDTLIRPDHTKDKILNPEGRVYFGGRKLYVTGVKFATASSMKLYDCRGDSHNSCRSTTVADNPETTCQCGRRRDRNVTIASDSTGESGFVKGVTTYMVMDNLEVKPMSGFLVVNLLNKLKIPPADVEEKVVELGLDEGMALVQAALNCNTVLTKVFLGA